MPEEQYSNREIMRMFGEVRESLDRIEKQTQKTNGRVNKLEGWRFYITGAIAVLVFIGLPLALYTVKQVSVNTASIEVIKATQK